MIQLLGGVDRDLLAVLAQALETDNTVSLGKEGIVGADAHVLAGVNVRAALAHQDIAGEHKLSVGTFDASWMPAPRGSGSIRSCTSA